MLDRYDTPEIGACLSRLTQLQNWWSVEKAVVWANEKIGNYPQGATHKIESCVGTIDQALADMASEIEKTTGHDVQSFVDAVRKRIEKAGFPDYQRYFHQDITSTDTTENAQALMLRSVGKVILPELDSLIEATKKQVKKWRGAKKVGRTHTQHGAATLLGLFFLWWYDRLIDWRFELERAFQRTQIGKIRGLVGTYTPNVTPEIETIALQKLGLKTVKVCGQIILRDRLAQLTSALGNFAGVLENMAVNIRLGAQTEVGEFSEPFKEGRKGSSAAPHKKNTDRCENVTGLMRVVRGMADIENENIVTWWERDISHSAPERIILDAQFHFVHFSLKRMTGIMADLVVDPVRMLENLKLTQGVIYSPEVKKLLMESGVDPETAYRLTQTLSQKAWRERTDFLDLLMGSIEVPDRLKQGELQKIFDSDHQLQFVNEIYSRFEL